MRAFASTTDHTKPPFDKVLIANRGEIAQRVMKTCHDMGIDTVAVYSTADALAPFVQEAREAICIGPAASSESYLNVDKICKAITHTGAQAVHPGYGFLSENADFAKQITDMGVAWLGPGPYAVQEMGDKLRSKELAVEAGVNTIPGYEGVLESVEQAREIANDIGYPILLKAAAGGGGKGMRTCFSDTDVEETYELAKAEAKKFFTDDRLLIEKYIVNPHHIEFQVLSGPRQDDSGELDICVFAERECSIQRRNQKIIEESPSVLLTEDTRQKMVAQVKTLVKQVGYVSAGTVEFLVDEQQKFYFLEMNTRLQVEHPVTEAVSGVDLVKGMLYVGAGRGVPPEFLEKMGSHYRMPDCGHAVEARVYAEDPLRGFLPSTGPLVPYQEPSLPNVRVDSGVAQGHVVSPFYDPMLSKVICWDETREGAVEGLARALDHYVIEGVQHNARLVNDVLRHPAFVKGDTPTSFLPTHYPDGFVGVQLSNKEKMEMVVAVAAIAKKRNQVLDQPPINGSGKVVVLLGGMFGEAYQVELDDIENPGSVHVSPMASEGEGSVVEITEPLEYEPTQLLAEITLNDEPLSLQVIKESETGLLSVQMKGANMDVLVQSPREYKLSLHMHEPSIVDTSNMVLSPMPGALISYAVEEGDHVEMGQELCIVEAMKMQNIIRSPRAGTVEKCRVDVGSSLKTDEIIIDLVPESSSDSGTDDETSNKAAA
eukprot:CAMPEP_0195303474 /NCGR_PEP_ID=MMETSP0707-20130614/32845_1 /TAXON_ID=33640 /ORGANISM="Asterionellopsis glacialis, Strain CCMP134" /LENGTH=712 /DNA_ID=CAMNT_0040367031 /DNA_START=167 /DNA_END=2305 /DNA_ORIENTATION=-